MERQVLQLKIQFSCVKTLKGFQLAKLFYLMEQKGFAGSIGSQMC